MYTSTLSARAGEHVAIHVSTIARRFDLRIARIGMDETPVWTAEGLDGAFHPMPDDACANGCGWPTAATVTVPADWRSGYYQVTATTAEDDIPVEEFHAFFVVRAATPTAPILLVLATNTYAAYNFYGGGSLYQNRDSGLGIQESQVSIRRPWMPGFLTKPDYYDIHVESRSSNVNAEDRFLRHSVSGVPFMACAAGWDNWERVLVEWAEREGYELDYAINSDLQLHPELLSGYRLMLSVGHDEYWSPEMRDTVEAFIHGGGNVCFLSGNTSIWKAWVAEDGATLGCVRGRATAYLGKDVGRPESRMTGVSYWYAGFSRFHSVAPNGPRGFLVYRPEHWIFEGAGVGYGDLIGDNGIVLRYELDGCPIRMENGLPYPAEFHDAHPSLEIVGMAPAALEPGDFPGLTFAEVAEMYCSFDPRAAEYVGNGRGHATMAISTNGGTVFSAGTTDWTNGLKGGDPAVEQVTRNLLDRLSGALTALEPSPGATKV